MRKIYILIIMSISLFSCIEDFDLKIEDYTPKYTIEAIISGDVDNNFVRVSKIGQTLSSKDILIYGSEKLPKELGVEHAVVIIKDTKGNIYEFLKPLNPVEKNPYYLNYNEFDYFNYGYGYYKAPEGFKAIVGETYTLSVAIDNEEYTATSTVLDTPEITNIDVRKQKLEIQKDEAYVPFISFVDTYPNRTNYYISQLYVIDENSNSAVINSSSRVWGYSIFDDALLNTNVKDFMISFGTAPDHDAWYPQYADRLKVVIMSVDKNTYDYYQILISQIKNEGGMYSQTPGSPKTNIKGGALGYFIAADISSIISEKK